MGFITIFRTGKAFFLGVFLEKFKLFLSIMSLFWAAGGLLVLELVAYQGIVGCTPTNVPLWEIPILALDSGYLLFFFHPQESPENTS